MYVRIVCMCIRVCRFILLSFFPVKYTEGVAGQGGRQSPRLGVVDAVNSSRPCLGLGDLGVYTVGA